MTFDVSKMLGPDVYSHPVDKIEFIETHISWVILTGEFAYKLKKPVNFGFLDFSTLEKRFEYCKQELRLNRRLAPAIYLEVVAIRRVKHELQVCPLQQPAPGEVIEYAVKMWQFPQSAQMDNMLSAGEIRPQHMDAIALMAANFHKAIDVADESMPYGSNKLVYQPVVENFALIEAHIGTTDYNALLLALRQWCEAEFEKLHAVFRQRKHDGFIRECHGDMHLRNLVWLDQGPCAFDCIEFNPQLRWVDVMSDVAFLVMDLQDRQQYQFASRFINAYLENTGDYAGLSVLTFYLCYRALVRAKVSVLRLEQEQIAAATDPELLTEFETYLKLALSYTRPASPRLIIMRGMSASGKSTLSQQLLEKLGAIRIRSDVERKRLFAAETKGEILPDNDTDKINRGIYTKQASIQTYSKLAGLSQTIISAGYTVIVDAAFLEYEKRLPFQHLARELGVSYVIIEVTASADILRERIINRKHDVSDADLPVLEHQLANWQSLHTDEKKLAITVDTGTEPDIDVLLGRIDRIAP